MPRRSNLLQRTVKLIEEAKGGFLTIDESALLPDKETGEKREVDIILKGTLNSHPITVSFEVVDRSRKIDSGWVEQMLRKHQTLPTDKLILVSGSGFTKPARKKAEYNHVKIIDLSGGDHQLRNFLECAAYIQGATATVTCIVKVDGVPEVVNPDAEIEMGKLRQAASEQAKVLLRNTRIQEILLETDSEQDEAFFEAHWPYRVTVYGRKQALIEQFDGIFFIIDVKRKRIPVQLSSVNYDGIEFVYGTIGHSDATIQFVSSLDGDVWQEYKIVDTK